LRERQNDDGQRTEAYGQLPYVSKKLSVVESHRLTSFHTLPLIAFCVD